MYRFSLPFPCPMDTNIKRRTGKLRSNIPVLRDMIASFKCETPLQFAAVHLSAYGLNVFPTLCQRPPVKAGGL